MQDDLFGSPEAPTPPVPSRHSTRPTKADAPEAAEHAAPPAPRKRSSQVTAMAHDDALTALAAALPRQLRLGTSSWTYPGWKGLVWEGEHSDTQLSKQGLAVYVQHPLMRTVSIDRSFYRPLTVSQYERYASQVPDDFRFVVKAPSVVTDALVRSEDGRGRQANPAFLSPELARSECVEPALQGAWGTSWAHWCSSSARCRWRSWTACRCCWSACAPCCSPCQPSRPRRPMG